MSVANWYICRHGETDYNRAQLVQGNIDIPLNDNGRQQAGEAKEKLQMLGVHFDRIYASPLSRALETAEILSGLPRSEFLIDERIVEMGFGVREGLPYIGGNNEITVLNEDPENYIAPPEGEELQEVFDRTASFIEELKTITSEHILIATHGMAIRGLIAAIRGTGKGQIWETSVGNCDIFHFRWKDGVVEELPMLLRHGDPYDPHD